MVDLNKLTMDETAQLAASHVEEFLCSEAVLMSLARCLGVESKLIPKIATGLGGEGEVCSALSGAVRGLGPNSAGTSPVSGRTAGGPTGTPPNS